MALRDLFSGDDKAANGVLSFDRLVTLQFDADHAKPGFEGEAAEHVRKLWRSFADREGEVVTAFFGRLADDGVALTVKAERRSIGRGMQMRPRLHVALDLARAGKAADLVSRYERIRVKADQLLKGAEREHVTRVLYDRICRVIRIIDRMLALGRFRADSQLGTLGEILGESTMPVAKQGDREAGKLDAKRRNAARKKEIDDEEDRIENALMVASEEALQAEELCNRAVRRGAMMAYFEGMLLGTVVFTALGTGVGFLLKYAEISGFGVVNFLTVVIAGAVGAIVSVMSRMSSGDSWLEYETARSYLRLLGMFRPLIGAIFGLALYFGIQSGVLELIKPPGNENAVFFFFAFTAFLAGFSERWASDVLVPIKSDASPSSSLA